MYDDSDKENYDINSDELTIVSPGFPPYNYLVENSKNKISDYDLFLKENMFTIWISGTNGKTTTTALIEAIFQQAGVNGVACGNIGYAACELALESKQKKLAWIIAEVSSYQIESSFQLAPEIGVWTTFTPDHLNRHKNLANYYEIKARLLKRCQHQIFNGDDSFLRNLGLNNQWEDAYWTSVSGPQNLIGEASKGVYILDGWITAFGELIAPISLFKMAGKHNLQNLLMAIGAARLAGIEKGAIAEAISIFPGVPHRLELICSVRGVDYINDSKATNYEAAQVGLNSVDSPVILIAGGESKEGDEKPWIDKIKSKCAMVLLIGEAASLFADRLEKSGYQNYLIVETMDNAVIKAQELASKSKAKVVLLSPACASFDQYRSFEHRGDHFRELCLNLK
jgi:UDP-N-acetylmuramoylalanine--D-glutamate ligase